VYATDGDLTGYGLPPGVVQPAPPESTRMLTRASQRVDGALRSAVYATDSAYMPTEQVVKDAMRDAVCAQVAYWLSNPGSEQAENGGPGSGQWDSVSIGSVSLSGRKSTSDGTGAAPRLCDDALAHLRDDAGLLPGHIVTGGVERGW
jgi:hypothetical protein